MSDYFDFVWARTESGERLYHAPAWTCLERGDTIRVEKVEELDDGGQDIVGEELATVRATLTLGKDDKSRINFIMVATGSSPDVPKVLGRFIYHECNYHEEAEDGTDKD